MLISVIVLVHLGTCIIISSSLIVLLHIFVYVYESDSMHVFKVFMSCLYIHVPAHLVHVM